MAKYNFRLQNYHAVKDANIIIDGITVLAGINGCGKSTISRWLYYIINTISRYDEIQKKYFVNSLVSEVDRISRFFRATPYYNKYRNYFTSFNQLSNSGSDFESDISDIYMSFSLQVENDLSQYLSDASPLVLKRAFVFLLGQDEIEGNSGSLVTQYSNKLSSIYQDSFDAYKEVVREKSIGNLSDVIKNEFNEEDSIPNEIKLSEDGVSLFENGRFLEPLMLNNVIYIDTPMALSEHANPDRGSVWYRFKTLLENPNNVSCINADTQKLSQIVRGTIHGNVKLEEDDLAFSKELHYVREDGLNIKIGDTATGIKSFAYILRLVENCWLNGETILMIDEPEAHLHPQWVVEFARLLVLLHKYLGVKIVIASHDPDMISAIHDMTEYYAMEGETNFYIAKENESDRRMYEYEGLGHEIGEIFESFNMAFIRINDFIKNQ